ncbi:MAG: gliding motility-associated C-terminal domain-containing protein [Chitinophagaceae bacterium]|nr:gliding motility-associated C-terminal domain-containing protein [Chitinophagaceae bacterium]
MPEVRKYWFVLVIALLGCCTLQARHITGGELSYIYTGSSGNTHSYQITLRLYRDCFSTGAQLDPAAMISIFTKNASGASSNVENFTINMTRRETLRLEAPGKCIDNPPAVCYEVGVYIFTANLPATPYGYTITYQRCCRIENMSNVSASGQTGATYTADIPGNIVLDDAPKNSSAVYSTRDTVIVCEDNFFMYDFGAFDKDGDSLSYNFAAAYVGGSPGNPQPVPAGPPYTSVPYSFGFGAMSPMGANVTIDRKTGMVSGVAPSGGIYVVTVAVSEYRKGMLINVHRKDIQIKVASCSIAAASLPPEYVSCDSFTVNFQNRSSSSLIRTYYWDFGVEGRNDDTSTVARPSFTFPDTGVYRVTLVTNRGEECSDTALSIVKVYPGFFPGFVYSEGCKDVPIFFTDTTKTRYGFVDTWSWDFGDGISVNDTSTRRNAPYTYTSAGTYTVALTVSNSKGCKSTVTNQLVVRDKPLLSVPHDTLMCDVDTISLVASGPLGTYTWSPGYNISALSGPVVQISPDITTTYSVSLTTVPGCTSTDTVRVNVVSFVTLDAGPDFTMCLTDSVQLNPFSNGLRYSWDPVSTLDDPFVKQPVATPADAFTTYTVTSYIGKCFARDNIRIRAVPYPDARVSGDTVICYGEKVQLFADGGAYYRWSPVTGINNYTVPDPVVSPGVTTIYTVSVTDTLGCPKPTNREIEVRVIPPVPAFAGNDTVAVLDQPLQLQATGAEFYKWSPGSFLSNTDIADPIATFVSDVADNVTYSVKVSTPEGCFAYDTVSIRIFRTAPDIFVATAFTPNNDGLNDYFRAMPVGIQQFDYLKIYNRWGQLMFSTSDSEEGWDGKYKGVEQASDTFVWTVKGTDYLGRTILKKGTMVLIR